MMKNEAVIDTLFSCVGQDNFVRKWDEVIKDRRMQRIQLDHIDEGMKTKTFTSKDAREIW